MRFALIALLLLLSIVVAAALQNEWGFSLDLYLPTRPRIEADHQEFIGAGQRDRTIG